MPWRAQTSRRSVRVSVASLMDPWPALWETRPSVSITANPKHLLQRQHSLGLSLVWTEMCLPNPQIHMLKP